MYKTSFRISLFVIILMLPWIVVEAAGLGKLTLNSALGQPLNAEIDIITAPSDEIPSLKVSVATRDVYAQAGLSYEPILSSIKATVASRTNGNAYVKLTSPHAINDPFLMVLLELSWSSGRILREYTVLLDPIETTHGIAAANTNSSSEVSSSNIDIAQNSVSPKKSIQAKKTTSQASGRGAQQNRNSYGPVNRGDTLSTIARQTMPAGVSLNQMLVALHRINRDAFIGGNMNLLKTGVILKIPEKSEIIAVDAVAANAEIKIQVDDWRKYQAKLAAASREKSSSRAIKQSDQGQITTRLDNKSSAVANEPREVLKLSSSAQLPDASNESTDTALGDRLRMMEEDAIARNLALKEANERVAILEKSVQNLKHLLELKDAVLAQAQNKAESSLISGAEIEDIPSITSNLIAEPEIQSTPATDSLQEAPALQNMPELQERPAVPVISPKPASPEETSSSLTDLIFEYIEYLGAASILVLLLILLVLKRRRDKLQEEVDEDDFNKDNFSSTMRSRMSVMGATAGMAADNKDHSPSPVPHEEDEQYEEMDSYAEPADSSGDFDKDPGYYDEAEEYNEISESSTNGGLPEDIHQPGRAMQSAFDEDVDHVSELDQAHDFANDTDQFGVDFADTAEPSSSSDTLDFSPPDLSTDSSFGEKADFTDEIAGNPDYSMEVEFDATEESLQNKQVIDDTVAEEKIDELDFDLSDTAIDLTENSNNEVGIPELEDQITLEENTHGESLAFESSSVNVFDEAGNQSDTKIPDLGLADINLELDEQQGTESPGDTANSEEWQEVETKLDLAKAYLEMDDKEGAKEMLQEVIQDGDAKQKKAAKKMLKGL